MASKKKSKYFPKCYEEGGFLHLTPSYRDIISSFGFEILISKDENNYQGDSWYLLKDNARYGYLCFGWGSCSGCDALEACDTLAELDELRDKLLNSIIWKNSKQDMKDYFKTKWWDGEFYSDKDEFKDFLKETKTLLK